LYVLCLVLSSTTRVHSLSLHDALPIFRCGCVILTVSGSVVGSLRTPSSSDRVSGARFRCSRACSFIAGDPVGGVRWRTNCSSEADRKSTRLNSSHGSISYAVLCLKKNK